MGQLTYKQAGEGQHAQTVREILIDMMVEGLLDGRQGEEIHTIIPLINLNMVSCLPWFIL